MTIPQSGSPAIGQPAVAGITFPRSSSYTTEELLEIRPACWGSEFSQYLPNSRVATQGGNSYSAYLAPVFDAEANLIDNAAYCIYRLRCFNEAETAAVNLKWRGLAPAVTECWVGVSNWDRVGWDWHYLPESGTLDLNPARFSNADHFGYVAVVLLGSTPATLQRVSLACNPDGTAPYTLYAPQEDQHTYLINRQGLVAREWSDDKYAASTTYLLDDLNILKTTTTGTTPLKGVGVGGGIERWDFDGNVLWSVDLGTMGYSPHHDIARMPNGNILVIAWEAMTRAAALENGRATGTVGFGGFWFDSIIEIEPTGAEGAAVVWEWHLIDHLVQEFSPDKLNYGAIDEYPGRLDINFNTATTVDLTHANSIDYNAELDQIVLSLRTTSEFYIIDHSTTTAEAATGSGGRCGRGGEFLYRWGNPAIWHSGTAEDQFLFGQHDVEWIPDGCPGAGHLLMFNNGEPSAGNNFSRIEEIEPPLNPNGTYRLEGSAYGPAAPYWEYVHDPPTGMFSWAMSGCQRLPDGNTLICVAIAGWFLEVDPGGTMVWQYFNEFPEPSMKSVFRADTYYLFTPWLEL